MIGFQVVYAMCLTRRIRALFKAIYYLLFINFFFSPVSKKLAIFAYYKSGKKFSNFLLLILEIYLL